MYRSRFKFCFFRRLGFGFVLEELSLVANGFMLSPSPRRSCGLAARRGVGHVVWWSSTKSPWWGKGGLSASTTTFFNKRFGVLALLGAALLSAGLGGEGERSGCLLTRMCKSSALGILGRSRRAAEWWLQFGLLQWMEAVSCNNNSATSSIRSVNRNSSGGGVDWGLFAASHSGNESKEVPRVHVFLLLDEHQGRSFSSPGRFLTAAFCSSSFSMVGWQPLPPSSSASASSGRRSKDLINLQAAMPQRRPSGSGVVCSRLLAPSGCVPGGVEADCAELRVRHTGEGAGPGCVPHYLLRVFCAICKGLVVIFIFLSALSVRCTSVDLMEL